MRDGIAQISPDLLGNDLDDETKKFKPKANPGGSIWNSKRKK